MAERVVALASLGGMHHVGMALRRPLFAAALPPQDAPQDLCSHTPFKGGFHLNDRSKASCTNALPCSSQPGTGRPFDRRNSGLKSLD